MTCLPLAGRQDAHRARGGERDGRLLLPHQRPRDHEQAGRCAGLPRLPRGGARAPRPRAAGAARACLSDPLERSCGVVGAAAPPRRRPPRARAAPGAPAPAALTRRCLGRHACSVSQGAYRPTADVRARPPRRRERVQPAQGVRGGREERAGHHLHRRDRLHRAQAREDAGARPGDQTLPYAGAALLSASACARCSTSGAARHESMRAFPSPALLRHACVWPCAADCHHVRHHAEDCDRIP